MSLEKTETVELTIKEMNLNLEEIKSNLIEEYKKNEENLKFYNKIDEDIEKIKNFDFKINLNIGGQKYKIKPEILLALKDNLFYILLIKAFNLNLDLKTHEFFIDRDFKSFKYVIETLNYGYCSYEPVEPKLKNELLKELEFYGVTKFKKEKFTKTNNNNIEIKILNFVIFKASNNQEIKRFDEEEIIKYSDLNNKTGITVNKDEFIVLELEKQEHFTKMQLIGYNKDNHYGKKSIVYTSLDNINYIKNSKIPNDYKDILLTVNCKSLKAKFIKIQPKTESFGFVYLKLS